MNSQGSRQVVVGVSQERQGAGGSGRQAGFITQRAAGFNWKEFVDKQPTTPISVWYHHHRNETREQVQKSPRLKRYRFKPIASRYPGYVVSNPSMQFRMICMFVNMVYEKFDFSKSPTEMYGGAFTASEYKWLMGREVVFWNENFKIEGLSDAEQNQANKYLNAIVSLRGTHHLVHTNNMSSIMDTLELD